MPHAKHNVYLSTVVVLIIALAIILIPLKLTGMASYECINPENNRDLTSSTALCPGKYYLRDAGSGAIRINSPNVTLDCKGAEIVGDGNGIGIAINARNVELKNCIIKGYETGISTTFDQLTMQNMSATASKFGLYIYNASDIKINSGKIGGAKYGVHATQADNLLIENVEISGSEKTGIYLYDIVGGTIKANTITNSGTGIHVLKNSKAVTFSNNKISGCGDGIFIKDLGEHTICSNTLENNQRGIIAMNSVGRLKIINNSISKSAVRAISLLDTDYNELTANTITSNGDGVVLSGSSSNTLYANKIASNDRGITISETSKDNVYHHNEFIGNKMHIPLCPRRNEFSTTSDGIKQGNYWDEITKVNITDKNADGYGDSAFKSSPKVVKIGVGITDDGPILDRKIIANLNITLPTGCEPITIAPETSEEMVDSANQPAVKSESWILRWLGFASSNAVFQL